MSVLYFQSINEMTNRQKAEWQARWSNFTPAELCSDDESLKIDTDALDGLQELRVRFGKPIRITSAYRDPVHNRKVGGGKNSRHMEGDAFDIVVLTRKDGRLIERLAVEIGFTAIGRYWHKRFIHIDHRPPKASGAIYQWGERF